MGKCESCGAENASTQSISVGKLNLNVCGRCYASIEKDKAEKKYYESQMKHRITY
jgi:ribosome-binding protein aMBF1 (putative translation factor)